MGISPIRSYNAASVPQGHEAVRRQGRLLDMLAQQCWRLVHGLVRQAEGAAVHAHAAPALHVQMDLHRLSWVDVLHEAGGMGRGWVTEPLSATQTSGPMLCLH